MQEERAPLSPDEGPLLLPAERGPLPPDMWLSMALPFYGVVLLLAGGIAYLHRGRQAFQMGQGETTLTAIGCGLVVGVVLAVGSQQLRRFPRWQALFAGFRRLIGVLPPRHCLILALTSGIAEEALFRGALQPWCGVLVSALLFALLHAPSLVGSSLDDELVASFSLWPYFAFVVALVFAGLTIVTETWFSAAAAHGMVNYLNLRYLSGNEVLDAASRSEDDTGLS